MPEVRMYSSSRRCGQPARQRFRRLGREGAMKMKPLWSQVRFCLFLLFMGIPVFFFLAYLRLDPLPTEQVVLPEVRMYSSSRRCGQPARQRFRMKMDGCRRAVLEAGAPARQSWRQAPDNSRRWPTGSPGAQPKTPREGARQPAAG